jgi:hypothetical protein
MGGGGGNPAFYSSAAVKRQSKFLKDSGEGFNEDETETKRGSGRMEKDREVGQVEDCCSQGN